MKAGWKTVKLEEVCAIEFGERVVRKNDAGTLYPVYGGGGATFNIDRHNRESCVVVSRFGMSERCVRFVEGKFFLNDSGLTVTSTSPEVSQGYINLLLHAKAPEIYALGGGTAQKNLDTKSFRSLQIPLPPLAEQKRIVALLDEAFARIDEAKAKAQASIQSLGTLVVSEFQSLVDKKGFERKPLPELASHTLGKMLDKKKNSGTPRPYLRNVNVRWFEFDLSDIHEMPIRDEEVARCQARKGDVLMCEGGYPGRCAIWRSDEPVFFQKALHRIRFNEKWMAEWFVNYMHSLDSSGKISEFFTGTGIQHLTGETLSKLEIPVPPKSEIEAYVKKISAIREETNDLNANERAKLAALSDLKASLLAQAFAGDLTA